MAMQPARTARHALMHGTQLVVATCRQRWSATAHCVLGKCFTHLPLQQHSLQAASQKERNDPTLPLGCRPPNRAAAFSRRGDQSVHGGAGPALPWAPHRQRARSPEALCARLRVLQVRPVLELLSVAAQVASSLVAPPPQRRRPPAAASLLAHIITGCIAYPGSQTCSPAPAGMGRDKGQAKGGKAAAAAGPKGSEPAQLSLRPEQCPICEDGVGVDSEQHILGTCGACGGHPYHIECVQTVGCTPVPALATLRRSRPRGANLRPCPPTPSLPSQHLEKTMRVTVREGGYGTKARPRAC